LAACTGNVSPLLKVLCLHLPCCFAVALEFRRNTSGRIGREDFIWTVDHVMGIKLNPELVGSAGWDTRRQPAAAGTHRMGLCVTGGALLSHAAPWVHAVQVDLLFYLFSDDTGSLNIRCVIRAWKAAMEAVR
jgi:hypothetical protein